MNFSHIHLLSFLLPISTEPLLLSKSHPCAPVFGVWESTEFIRITNRLALLPSFVREASFRSGSSAENK